LVYNRSEDSVSFSTFKDLLKYLPPKAVLVLNQTKVVPARLLTTKETGGRVEVLYLTHTNKEIHALANRKLAIGTVLFFGTKYTLTVTKLLEKGYAFRPNFPAQNIYTVLHKYGATPTPPYIKNIPLSEKKLRSEYQTVFAKMQGSSAAPTASLHFTSSLLAQLKKAGVALEYVTLHVGLGTFAPLTDAQVKSGKLHEEWYEITPATARRLGRYKKEGRPIVAVGTTVVRTLESAATAPSALTKLSGHTDLFIYPPYTFKFIDSLITNFHVPKSSLMMLVASLTGREKLLELYAAAVKKKFRLFSFGDGMLII
jgi:S-adenosylmethionine:tRNA ribosyltransferase-isomerase